MEMPTPKYSITRKITIAIFLVVALLLVQFTGVYLSSQRLMSGLATLHNQQQFSYSILQLHQLTDLLVETPGKQGGSPEDDRRLFGSVFAQAEAKISEARVFAQGSPGYVTYLDQIADALNKLNASAQTYFLLTPSLASQREFLLIRQYSSDIAEGEEKLKILIDRNSNELFNGVYKMRHRPFAVAITLTLLFVMLALIIGTGFKRQVSASIANLLSATQEIARGNLNVRAPILVRDEIGTLTAAFNAMTRELRQSTVSRNYVEAVIQSLPDSLFVLSPEGLIEQVNKSVGNLYGGDNEALKGEFLCSFLGPNACELTTELRDVEAVFNSQSGIPIPVSISASVIRDQFSRVTNIVCVMKDLTERKGIESERRHIAESQLALADASSILTESIDSDVTLKNIVRAAVPHLSDCCFVHIVDEKGSLTPSEFNCGAQKKGTPLFQVNPVIMKAFHSKAPQFIDLGTDRLSGNPASPDISSYIVHPLFYRDRDLGTITFGFFEREPSSARRDLDLIAEFSRRAMIALENSRLYHEAQEAILSRDEFLSIASHELKTPLTALSLQLQILNREILKSQGDAEKAADGLKTDGVFLPARILKTISSSEGQSKKLAVLLDELLDLTRIRLGKLELAKEDTDLNSIVKGVADRFKVVVGQKGIVMDIDLKDSIVGSWDPMRIEQIVSNLISNAVKYGDGSAISVKTFRDGDVARLVVSDRGKGIPEEMRDKIFERFERAGVSGAQISGLGLGLYICRQIIEAHGGSIHVESELGRGASFVVDLPLRYESDAQLAG
jgi:PAS domain S-box-containing protein